MVATPNVAKATSDLTEHALTQAKPPFFGGRIGPALVSTLAETTPNFVEALAHRAEMGPALAEARFGRSQARRSKPCPYWYELGQLWFNSLMNRSDLAGSERESSRNDSVKISVAVGLNPAQSWPKLGSSCSQPPTQLPQSSSIA